MERKQNECGESNVEYLERKGTGIGGQFQNRLFDGQIKK